MDGIALGRQVTPPYDNDDRRRLVGDDHVKLLIAEMINVALKDQKHHLVAYIDKSIAASESKTADRYEVFTERQFVNTERLKKCEATCDVFAQSLQRIDSKVERWVNRGVGVWALAVAIFALVQYGTKFIGK